MIKFLLLKYFRAISFIGSTRCMRTIFCSKVIWLCIFYCFWQLTIRWVLCWEETKSKYCMFWLYYVQTTIKKIVKTTLLKYLYKERRETRPGWCMALHRWRNKNLHTLDPYAFVFNSDDVSALFGISNQNSCNGGSEERQYKETKMLCLETRSWRWDSLTHLWSKVTSCN